MKVKINEIVTNERVRKDLGDITELAADIEENGQISPIAITTDNVLIAGGRRLAACTQLGWTEIEAIVLEIREAEKLVQLEMAENIARKELTFSEKMSYAQKLEIIESEKARLRQEHRSEDAISGVSLNLDEAGRTAEIVGKACGIGGKDTYKKAKSIFESGDEDIIGRIDRGKISIHRASGMLKKPKPVKAKSPSITEHTDKHPEIVAPEAPADPIEMCNSFIGTVEDFNYQLKQSTNKIEMSTGIRGSINDCRMLLLRTVDDLMVLTGDKISKIKSDTKSKRAKKTKTKATTKSLPKKKVKGKQKAKSIEQSQKAKRKKKTIAEEGKQIMSEKSGVYESELPMAEGI